MKDEVTVHSPTFSNNLVLTSYFPTLFVEFAGWVGRAVRIVVMCRKNICESSAFLFSSALLISHPKKREISFGLYLQLYPTVQNKCKTISRDPVTSGWYEKYLFLFFPSILSSRSACQSLGKQIPQPIG